MLPALISLKGKWNASQVPVEKVGVVEILQSLCRFADDVGDDGFLGWIEKTKWSHRVPDPPALACALGDTGECGEKTLWS